MEGPPDGSLRGPSRRLAGIEGFRGVAALSVLAMHVWQVTGTTAGLTSSRARPMAVTGTWVDAVLMQGILGVQLFFVLSGVLLFFPYAAALVNGGRRPRTARYLMRRFRRIFPLYWVVLAAFVAAMAVGSTMQHGTGTLLVNILLLQAYTDGMVNVLPLAWTLPIEIGFYVLVPLIAVALGPAISGLGKRTSRIAVTAVALVVLGGISVALRRADLTTVGELAVTRTIAWHFDSFAAGMLLALVLVATRRQLSGAVSRACVVAGAALFAMGAALRLRSFSFLQGADVARDVWQLAVAAGCALIIGGVVISADRRRFASHLLDSRVMRWLGEISYGIYLWHWVVIAVVRRSGLLNTGGGSVALLVNGALVLAATLALSTATYRLIERPIMRGQLFARLRGGH